jgi:hypothetical protein
VQQIEQQRDELLQQARTMELRLHDLAKQRELQVHEARGWHGAMVSVDGQIADLRTSLAALEREMQDIRRRRRQYRRLKRKASEQRAKATEATSTPAADSPARLETAAGSAVVVSQPGAADKSPDRPIPPDSGPREPMSIVPGQPHSPLLSMNNERTSAPEEGLVKRLMHHQDKRLLQRRRRIALTVAACGAVAVVVGLVVWFFWGSFPLGQA